MYTRSFLGLLAISSLATATSKNYCATKKVYSTVTVEAAEYSTEIISTRPTPSQWPRGGPARAAYSGPAWLPSGSDLKPSLTPEKQSGDCPLGRPGAPHYGGPLSGDKPGSPWGESPPWSDDCKLIDPAKVPDTGKLRKYNFEISYREIAPDGVKKQGLVINNQFPGPTIEGNWGDWVEITVKNNLEGELGNPEGTSIHWHGILQTKTPFMDGVPSVTQCPISPGDYLTYKFQLDQYGTTWYHSHYSAQYSAGIYGAMIIHGPNDSPKCAGYDEDIGPVLVGDWYHDKYYDLVAKTFTGRGGPPPSNSNLVNGRANYPCHNTTRTCTPNAGLSKFKFESGKKHRMRLINPSSDSVQKISIDGHKFKVIAQDFVPIVPFETDLITLAIGQRSDVIIEAVGKPTDSFWFRSNLGAGPGGCSSNDGIAPEALAVIYYEDADPNTVPTTNTTIANARILSCNNDPLPSTPPLFPISAKPVGEVHTQVLNIDFVNNGTNFVWTVNNSSARLDMGVAQLEEAAQGTLSPKPQWNLYSLPNSGTARIVMYNSFPFSGHPMHLHGHNFQVLDEGFGNWNGTIQNRDNPVRRDVQFLQKARRNPDGSITRAYTVIQFELDNAAINIFHCHLAWHVSGGLYVAFVERPAEIRKFEVPQAISDTCSRWAEFSTRVVSDQIDSGL